MNENYLQFFTATILEWKHLLKEDKYKHVIIKSLQFLISNNRIKLYCYVIMPNHIHLIWEMQNNHKREHVQRDFLKYTAQQIKFDLLKYPEILIKFYVGAKDRQYQIWERNPKTINLYSRKMVEQKMNYIHNNPLQEKWNIASSPELYRFSSAGFYEENLDEFKILSHYMEVV